jgi:hypothetical protein
LKDLLLSSLEEIGGPFFPLFRVVFVPYRLHFCPLLWLAFWG